MAETGIAFTAAEPRLKRQKWAPSPVEKRFDLDICNCTHCFYSGGAPKKGDARRMFRLQRLISQAARGLENGAQDRYCFYNSKARIQR